MLSTALATNPRATRLLLMSLRMATTDSLLSTVDVLVLLLLFPRSSSASASTNGGVTDLVLRCVSCHALPFPVLLRLVDYTSDAHWAVLTTPLLELCKWLLLAPLTASSPPRGSGSRLVLLPDALAEASGWAARLLQRLYELHASSRDHILGFLLSLCINAALRKAYSESFSHPPTTYSSHASGSCLTTPYVLCRYRRGGGGRRGGRSEAAASRLPDASDGEGERGGVITGQAVATAAAAVHR